MGKIPADLITGLNQTKVNHIKALLAQVKAELDFVVPLDGDERSTINAVDINRFQFVNVTEEVVEKFPDSLELSTAGRDKILRLNQDYRFMMEIETLMQQIFSGVSDTTLLLGSFCYDEGLIVKGLVDMAVRRKKPGMEPFQKKLSKIFERPKRKKDEEDNEPEDSNGKGGPAPLLPEVA